MSESISRRRFLVAGASVLAVGAAALVGGTYAKYTTTNSDSDDARVAKFGVSITPSGDLFGETYTNSELYTLDANYSKAAASIEVVSTSASDSLVAPGTGSSEVGGGAGLSVTIAGTPEVAVEVEVAIEYKDVVLAAGSYKDGNGNDVKVSSAYYPITYTLTNTEHSSGRSLTSLGETVQEILKNFLTISGSDGVTAFTSGTGTGGSYTLTGKAKFAPKTDLSKCTFNLQWAWPIGANDTYDTLLGDMAADTKKERNNSVLTPYFGVKVTVTQID
jgi:hypothetical protein